MEIEVCEPCEPPVLKKKNNICIEENCTTQPCFNFKGEKRGIYCRSHAKKGMVDVKNHRCLDCDTRANYNFEGEKRGIYCRSHAKNGMVDLKNIFCKENGCKIQANYNFEGEKRGIYCLSHAKNGMKDVKNPRCIYEGCSIQPSFNFEGNTKSIYCSIHALDGMKNTRDNKCLENNCNKQPSYNFENQTKAIYCKSHSKEGMKNVVTKRCKKEGCDKIPCYNFEYQQKGIYCLAHAEKGMKDVRSRKCLEENCDKQPCYNFEGNKIGIYCVKHAKKDMENVVIRKCIDEFCYTGVTYTKYDGYCLSCFVRLFPDMPIVRNYKTKETAVRYYIKEQFSNVTWICDKITNNGCSMRRPDLLLDLGYQVLIIEIDENQHRRYEEICENKRIMELSQDLGHRPVVFIRFNPDDYKIGESKTTSCWYINKSNNLLVIKKSKRKEWNERLGTLKETVEYWMNNQTEKTIELVYLFYDKTT